MSDSTFIYGLCDPRNGHLRYVGKANKPRLRLYRHHCFSEKKNHRTDWLGNLKKDKLKPDLFIIEEVPHGEWEESERFWICYFRSLGCNLVNATSGGDGVSQMTPETREKLRQIALARGPHSAETKLKMSLAHKGSQYRLGTRNKHPRRPPSDLTLARMRAAHAMRPPRTDITRARMSAALKVVWQERTLRKEREALERKININTIASATCSG